jgi:hypothetical protein
MSANSVIKPFLKLPKLGYNQVRVLVLHGRSSAFLTKTYDMRIMRCQSLAANKAALNQLFDVETVPSCN